MARLFCLTGCVVVLLALISGAAAQTTHIVLDNLGWIIPQGGATAYTNWAATKTFMVGDTLVFNFTTGAHDVAQVTRTAFDACNINNPIGPLLLNGPVNITLNTTGDHYYICTFGQHCSAGQKLAINVSGSPSMAPPPSTSPPPTNGGPTVNTPPPQSTVPTPPERTTPPPQSTVPTAEGPGTSTPPNSASVVVAAANMFFVVLLSIAAIIVA